MRLEPSGSVRLAASRGASTVAAEARVVSRAAALIAEAVEDNRVVASVMVAVAASPEVVADSAMAVEERLPAEPPGPPEVRTIRSIGRGSSEHAIAKAHPNSTDS